jgi:hypothetical protein
MNISEINECFKNGYIHDALFYTIEKDKINIDPRKISYNNYYQSYDFYESKFKDISSIPGFDKVIENMSNVAITNNKTPLQELEELEQKIIPSER